MADSPDAHYTKADELLKLYNEAWRNHDHDRRMELLAQAQAHATLAASRGLTVPFTVPASLE